MRRRKKSALPAALPMVWWWDLATRSTEMLTASAEVIFHRSVRMGSMSNPPSAHDRGELSTMVTEKVAASQQFWLSLPATPWKTTSQLFRCHRRRDRSVCLQ